MEMFGNTSSSVSDTRTARNKFGELAKTGSPDTATVLDATLTS